MDDFANLLTELKEEPLKKIPRRSVFVLYDYITYYQHVRRKLGIPLSASENTYIVFNEWIHKKYDISDSFPWANIISLYSKDGGNAFELFFSLYDEYNNDTSFRSSFSFLQNREKYGSLKGDLKDLQEFIGKAKNCLSRKSIFSLEASINAYSYSRREVGIEITSEEKKFLDFEEWVKEKLVAHYERSWSNIIDFCSISEDHAFKIGINLIEEFYK